MTNKFKISMLLTFLVGFEISAFFPLANGIKEERKARVAIEKLSPGDTIFIAYNNDNPFIKMEDDTFIVKDISGEYVLYETMKGYIRSTNIRIKMTSDYCNVKFVKK